MTDTLAFFTGNVNAFNIERLVDNIGVSLSNHFNLHLITTKPEDFDTRNFKIFGSRGDSRFDEVKSIADYCREHPSSIVTQVTQPPIHGTICSLAVKAYSNGDFVYRYNGSTFSEYQLQKGVNKVRDYILYNLAGNIPLRLAHHCLTLGENGRTTLIGQGVTKQKISVLPPMINPSRFQSSNQKSLKDFPSQEIIGFVGRVGRLKGVRTLERIMPRVFEIRNNVKLVLVGPIEDNSIKKTYPERVELVGPVPPEEIPQYMSAFDVIVHPSLTEGVPRVLLEALCAGTPVIARNVGDIPEVTQNTFETDEEFLSLIKSYKSLDVDSPERFFVENLQNEYISFYQYLTNR